MEVVAISIEAGMTKRDRLITNFKFTLVKLLIPVPPDQLILCHSYQCLPVSYREYYKYKFWKVIGRVTTYDSENIAYVVLQCGNLKPRLRSMRKGIPKILSLLKELV
ncbi:hypothetical protein VNO78_12369 [Psophocarpus tetragonolobus]|uniref:Uncharacterized protein n=1 Tax=Psophocarpus tetragonolobus TaxID=3891 RepID=A0AAN9SPS0_PSOTE